MTRYSILWADDEIELLRPHILFLEKKGFDVEAVNSGYDAIEKTQENNFDIIFLDENMPGMSGLEALTELKAIKPNTPVVMITKSEEESIMEEAIGAKISDYLIKPIKPNQILLSIKKLLDKSRLVTEKTNMSYQQEFQQISMAFGDDLSHSDWSDIYRKLVYWDLEINATENRSMVDVLDMQKSEANSNFLRFVKDNYEYWLNEPDEDTPLLSHKLLEKKVFPLLQDGQPVFFILVDNMRFDQWKMLEPLISGFFNVEEEDAYYSILPTTTAFARNAIFSGLLPSEIQRKHPQYWVGDDKEEGKNLYEKELLGENLKRLQKEVKYSYHKIIQSQQSKQVYEQLNNLMGNDLNVIVYNFVDMLSHARTDMAMIKELASDEPAYRSLTLSWFKHSPFHDMLKSLAERKAKVVLTTDHGTIRTKRPFKIIGDRETNTNLRYKQGRNLNFDKKNVLALDKPEKFFLPKYHMTTSYAFAAEDYFFAYPNNYNHYVKYYKDTFQHGGVSLEEMVVPVVTLSAK